jgi:hypothetical protein
MPALAIGAVVAGVGSSIMGAVQASSDQQAASAAAAAAFQQIQAVNAPPDMAQQILLQKFQDAGLLTPAVEQAINAPQSQVSQVQQNAQLQSAQNAALQQMAGLSQTGLRPQDVAALNQIKNQAAQQASQQQAAVMQQQQARGLGGSGTELAADLAASQGAANLASQQGLQVGGIAAQNALSALGQYGGMATQLQQQGLNLNLTKAQAADQLNRFNVQNQLAVQQQNVAAQNAAQQYNLQNQQQISNLNTQMSNADAYRQLYGQQQNYQNQLGLAQAKSNALLGQAGYYQGAAQNIQNSYGNIGAGLSTGVGGLANYYAGQQAQDNQNQFQQNYLNTLQGNQTANANAPTAPGSSTGLGSYSDGE